MANIIKVYIESDLYFEPEYYPELEKSDLTPEEAIDFWKTLCPDLNFRIVNRKNCNYNTEFEISGPCWAIVEQWCNKVNNFYDEDEINEFIENYQTLD